MTAAPGRLVISGGTILTMDDAVPRASAVIVEDGRISRVVPEGEPGPPPPKDRPSGAASTLDLRGACLAPGFIDAHTHLVHWGLTRIRVDLGRTKSLHEALEVVAGRHQTLPPDDPLIAGGWDESRWSAPAFPSRADLDRITATRPVVLRRVCGHMAVANSAALARIPAGPQVDAASGVLVEDAAMGLARVFPPSAAELDRALEAAQESYHSMGVTAVHDMSSPDHLRAFARAEARGALKLGIVSILTRPHLEILASAGLGVGWTRGQVRIWGVKFFSDGSIGARTAALNEPYADAPGETGLLLLSPGEMESIVRTAEDEAIPIAVHAIGDRAIDMVVAAFESVLGGTRSSLGHRIEHLEMPGPGIVERMNRLGLVASVQPNFIAEWGHSGGMYEARLGTSRLGRMNPFRTILDAGVTLAFGSDAMPAGVLYGIGGAVAAPFDLQRVSTFEALAAATRGAALAAGDSQRGSIRPGARADFTILNHDPAAVTAARLEELEVVATIVAGETVCAGRNAPAPS